MRKVLIAGAAVLMVAASLAMADEPDDGIMGNYSGTIGQNTAVTAKIIALGHNHYRGIMHYSPMPHMPTKVNIQLRGEKEGNVTTLSGGETGHMSTEVSIKDGVMTGTTQVKNKKESVNMKRVFLKSPTLGMKPPKGAIVLFDGKNQDQWQRWPLKYNLKDDYMEVTGSSLVTKQDFGDCTIHVEFRCPFKPDARGQERGNSGVYVMGRYEIQVLDNFGDKPAWNLCGGIYKEAVPLVNACYPPLSWQTYDIDFTAAKFDASGKKTQNARITVKQNGVVIHNNVELSHPTPGGVSGTDAPKGPLLLQNHHNAVDYRNIWIVPK